MSFFLCFTSFSMSQSCQCIKMEILSCQSIVKQVHRTLPLHSDLALFSHYHEHLSSPPIPMRPNCSWQNIRLYTPKQKHLRPLGPPGPFRRSPFFKKSPWLSCTSIRFFFFMTLYWNVTTVLKERDEICCVSLRHVISLLSLEVRTLCNGIWVCDYAM